ncbi:MAG: aromatic amino acid ammonia-lyase [Spirochaetales bacterium]
MLESKKILVLGGEEISLADFVEAVKKPVCLQWDPKALDRAGRSRTLLEKRLQEQKRIYGVNTGFGEEGSRALPNEALQSLQQELITYHRAGTGEYLTEEESRAVLLSRILTLAQGYSGVRVEVVDRLIHLYQEGVVPQIPSLGSVGASGDLTPCSYVAALICGQGKAYWKGQEIRAKELHRKFHLEPLVLEAKEGLSLLNGTSVMTALAVLAWEGLGRIARWTIEGLAWGAEALQWKEEFFHPRSQELKGHAGAGEVSTELLRRAFLDPQPVGEDSWMEGRNVQPRYSYRCAPQVIGAFRDTLKWTGEWLKKELNGVDDNPLCDPENNRLYHCGNFSGFYVSLACDALRNTLALLSNLWDRQAQLLLDPLQNKGLGPNLVEWNPLLPKFGLKAVGIALTSLGAELHMLASPVACLSRPTESGNQDIVSFGTQSARRLREAEGIAWLALAHFLLVSGTALKRRLTAIGRPIPPRLEKYVSMVETSEDLGQGLEKLTSEIKKRFPA